MHCACGSMSPQPAVGHPASASCLYYLVWAHPLLVSRTSSPINVMLSSRPTTRTVRPGIAPPARKIRSPRCGRSVSVKVSPGHRTGRRRLPCTLTLPQALAECLVDIHDRPIYAAYAPYLVARNVTRTLWTPRSAFFVHYRSRAYQSGTSSD